MKRNETTNGARSIHERRGASDVYSKGGNPAARSRIQEAGRFEPAQARAEAKGQALRFPRPCRLDGFRFFRLLPGKLSISEALAGDLGNRQSEPLGIIHFLARVVAECLFVDIPEQVERLNADVGPVQATLQETPEVLHRVRVDVSIYVLNGVVDYGVLVFVLQTVVGLQGIAENRGTGFDALPNDWLEFLLGTGRYVTGDNLTAPLYHPEYDLLAFWPTSRNLRFALALVHIAGLAADESFINFNFPAQHAAVGVLKAKANPVEHVPCALLRNLERPVDLPRANAVLHAGLHPNRHQPLVQTEGRIFHDGPDLNGELGLRMTHLALPEATRSDVANVLRPARRADHAVLPFPAMGHKVGNAVVRVVEVDNGLLEGLWFVLNFAHTSTLAYGA